MNHHATPAAATPAALALAAALLAALALLAPAAPARAATSLAQGEIPDALRASFVQVELRAQSYQGEIPHNTLSPDLLGEHSWATAGYLVAPDLVIAPDFNVPPRFVRSWNVKWQGNTDTTASTNTADATDDNSTTTADADNNTDTAQPTAKNGKRRSSVSTASATASPGSKSATATTGGKGKRRSPSNPGAQVIAWAADRNAMLLKLSKPIPAAIPLEFAPADTTTPATLTTCYSVKYYADSRHRTAIEPLSQARWYSAPDGAPALNVPPNSIIATDDGTPLALAPSNTLPGDASWKTPWRDWPWIYEADRDALFEKLTTAPTAPANALIFADLKLRPQPVRVGENPFTTAMLSMRSNASNDPSARPQPAIILSPRRVLVLVNLAPADTARLEAITLRLADDTTVNARFIATVADYAALVVEPEHDLDAPIALPATPPDWGALREHLLLTIDLRLQGETRIARPGLARSLSVGYATNDIPDTDALSDADNLPNTAPTLAIPILTDTTPTLFIFDLDGNLLGIPLQTRPVNTDTNPFFNTTTSLGGVTTTLITATRDGIPTQVRRPQIIPASALAAYTADPATAAWADPANIPATDAEQRQLVWLGVDLQPLTRELAQAQNVADQTRNGATGALVTKVYPDSPAARAALQPGDVLLRLRRAGTRQDIPISAGNDNMFATFTMKILAAPPGQRIPDNMLDRLPPPWPIADNPLNQKLKTLGVDKTYELDYARDGTFATLNFTPEKGPAYYGTAPEATFETAGLNVKTLTFETRAFYKIPDDKTALIVSRVVAGSRAAVAGLLPYDLILEANDRPVTTPAALAALVKTTPKLNLLTRRISQTRLVTLDFAAADAPPK